MVLLKLMNSIINKIDDVVSVAKFHIFKFN